MDRRRHERFRSDLVIRVGRGYGKLRDLSASGVYFTTDQTFLLDEVLLFALEFPGASTGPLAATCEARVVRLEPRADGIGVAAAITDLHFRRLAG